MSDRTLVLLKPDTVERKLVGEVVARFEAKNLDVVAMDLRQLDAASARCSDLARVRHFGPRMNSFRSLPMVAEATRHRPAGAPESTRAAPVAVGADNVVGHV